MHMNKALYTLSYTCFTAGVAGILFTGLYVLVRDPKLFTSFKHFHSICIILSSRDTTRYDYSLLISTG